MSRFLNGNNPLKMKAKKGVISLQFNWILVLIIGGLILIFFISIVQKQRQISEENIAGTIQIDLQAILSSSHVSTETASIIEVPKKDINFNCEGLKVGNQFPAKFPYTFGPNLLKSDRNTISVFASDWSVPYRVTNFLYITSPDIRYIVDNSDTELAQALDKILPPQYIVKDGKSKLFMTREISSISSLSSKNNYKVRIIYFDSPIDPSMAALADQFNIKPKDVSVLFIQPSCSLTAEEKLDCDGSLVFYNLDSTGALDRQEAKYIGRASLLAAIFSENSEIYSCGMENAFERLRMVTSVYQSKAQGLLNYYNGQTCSNLFQSALVPLQAIQSLGSVDESSTLYHNLLSLKDQNDILLANSCPVLY